MKLVISAVNPIPAKIVKRRVKITDISKPKTGKSDFVFVFLIFSGKNRSLAKADITLTADPNDELIAINVEIIAAITIIKNPNGPITLSNMSANNTGFPLRPVGFSPRSISTTNVIERYKTSVIKIAYIIVLGIFFEGFFNSGLRYAKFEVIEVNNINNNKKAGRIPSNLIWGNVKVGLVIGAIINPETIKNTNNAIRINVNSNKVLIAIFCVLKIIKLVSSTGKIDIKVRTVSGIGMLILAKTSLNTRAKI